MSAKKKNEVAAVQQGQDTVPVKMEKVLLGGDLSSLSPVERVSYYKSVCDSIGVNWLTKPFEYLKLDGKLVLYATKDCTEQLRSKKKISLFPFETKLEEDMYGVTVRVTDGDREDFDIGVVDLTGLKGKFKANAMMKALTKAKRRATLSISGLGMIDDSEVEYIPGAQRVAVDMTTGEIETRDTERGREETQDPVKKQIPSQSKSDGASQLSPPKKQNDNSSPYPALDASSDEIQEILNRFDGFNPWLEVMPISKEYRGKQLIHCPPSLLEWVIEKVVDKPDLVDMCRATLEIMEQIDAINNPTELPDEEPPEGCPF